MNQYERGGEEGMRLGDGLRSGRLTNNYAEDIQQVVDEAVEDLMEFEKDFTPEPDRAAIRAAFLAVLQDASLYDQFVAQYGQEAWDRRVSRL